MDHSPQTDSAWEIKEHHCVTCGETNFERAAVLPIYDPLLASRELLFGLDPLIFRGLHPARSPNRVHQGKLAESGCAEPAGQKTKICLRHRIRSR